MKMSIQKAGLMLFFVSSIAVAVDWYAPFKVPGTAKSDQEVEWTTALNTFKTNQGVINANGTMKPKDTVTFQYQDGTIVQFTLGPTVCNGRCVWGDTAFDPNKAPTIRQGAKPTGGKDPMSLGLTTGTNMPAMNYRPTLTSTMYTPSVTVTQTTPSGSATSVNWIYPPVAGGGGGGGGTPAPGQDCDPVCPPIVMK